METILECLDEIEEIIESSRPAPFSNKISVDKGALMEILDEIRLNLPSEIDTAQRIVTDHERILEDGRRKVQNMLAKAAEDAKLMAEEHEITLLAEEFARQIKSEAQRDAKTIRQNAMIYADGILSTVEEKVRDSLKFIRELTSSAEDICNENLDVISEGRQEIQGATDGLKS
ncbi:MAG: hypothetical protein LBU36_07050 [Clostridiales bacterium]|nr:hypothetical protein [Clostridiales bacterium]